MLDLRQQDVVVPLDLYPKGRFGLDDAVYGQLGRGVEIDGTGMVRAVPQRKIDVGVLRGAGNGHDRQEQEQVSGT